MIIFSESEGCRFDTKQSQVMLIFSKVWQLIYYSKPDHVNEMKMKLRKESVIVEYGQLGKLLGVQYKQEIFEFGEIYVVMSMKEKAE